MHGVVEILYAGYTAAFQILLLNAIFGRPRTTGGVVGQGIYGVLWAAALYFCGVLFSGASGFIPYLAVFLLFEIIFGFFGCKGSLLCRLVTMMASWTTFLLCKTLISYVGVTGYYTYLFSIILELILAYYIYDLRFNDVCGLDVKSSGDLSITCALMFFVTVSEVAVIMQDFRANFSMGDIGWKIITLFIMIEIVIYTMISFLSKEYSRKIYDTMVEEKKYHSSELKELHKLNHEIRNKVFYMKELIDAKNYSKLEEYFKDNFELKFYSEEDYTGNKVIDDCIRIKMDRARHNKIDFQIETGTLPEGMVDEGDLTELLFNLLDNAMDAEDDVKEKWVKLKMRFVKGYIYIDVLNATNYDVLKENPGFLTSKEDMDRHGFGMEIIREIVDKNNGMIKFSSDTNYFGVNIMLML